MSADRLALGLGRYLLDDDTARWSARSVRQLAAGRDVPRYGSPEWATADRALQVAAALVAAESYRRDELFRPLALADELAAEAYVDEQREAEEFRQIARQVRALGAAGHRSHAELVRLRAEVTRPGQAA